MSGIDVTPQGTRGGKKPGGPVLRFGMRVAASLHRMRHNRAMGLDILYLTTRGAKSGQQRTVPLAWFKDDGPGWLVIGSAGGAKTHPSWFVNMAAHPDEVFVEIDGSKVHVSATSLPPDEAADRISQAATTQPRYNGYREKTDRQIPVVRLVPADTH
jgi:deazaflavin-dependent oxidoreductase (nitroreductase family)